MKKFLIWFIPGLLTGIIIVLLGGRIIERTSGNEYCMSCHIHPSADASWKRSVHYETASGYRVACVECHLPPKGHGYLAAKARTGLRDLWNYKTKDSASFNWEEMKRPENARNYVYESSCLKCHENLFPLKLSKEGEDAHLYYRQSAAKSDLSCINCHLNAGHYIAGYTHGSNKSFGETQAVVKDIFNGATKVTGFSSFTEQIPRSSVSFRMIAIPGGKFKMGSPDNEPFRKADEGPVREVEISQFYMSELEVTWDEYLAFYTQTASQGKTSDTKETKAKKLSDVDAVSGATPPYGEPDKGWGLGQRPAISFTFHAATTYCKWLSMVTGKKYRLPTEAEWEYACRAGTETPYFFAGDPSKFQKKGRKGKIVVKDTSVINSYVIYSANSFSKTETPDLVKANPFGLKNMSGNVAEFCSDWYQPDAYSKYPAGIIRDPKGPESGEEHVIRGGSYLDPAGDVRSASRNFTHTADWLKTDPQIPKSIWWYSDCFHVGFRVVCEFDENSGKL